MYKHLLDAMRVPSGANERTTTNEFGVGYIKIKVKRTWANFNKLARDLISFFCSQAHDDIILNWSSPKSRMVFVASFNF